MTQLLNLEIYQFIFVFLRIGSAILLTNARGLRLLWQ